MASSNKNIFNLKLIFLGICCFLNTTIFSQNQKKIDSLLLDLKKTTHDTTKVNDYNKLFIEYRKADTVKAKHYVRLAISLAENISFKKGIGTALYYTGILYVDREDYKNCLQYYARALKIRKELKDDKGIALCLNSIGNAYYFLGNYPEALKNYQASLVIRDKIGPPVTIAYACSNIGEVYRQQGNKEKAIEYIKRALEILDKNNDKKGLANNYNNLGLIYKESEQYVEALEYINKSLELYEQVGEMESLASTYNNIGIIYAEQGKPRIAIEFYEKTLKLSDSLSFRNQTATTLINMAEAYTRLKEYQKALSNVNRALKLAEQMDALPLKKSCYDNLFLINNAIGNTKDALMYYIRYSEIKDSLFNEEKHKQVTDMEGKYQNEKKEKEIQFKNTELEKQNIEIKQQKTQKFALAGGIVFLLLLAVVVFISYKRIHKVNKLLEQHQSEIENKNSELSMQNSEILSQRDEIQSQHTKITQIVFNITESIRYAEKIQLALFPSEKIIKENFSDFFILYKPKDIVSGDFYWVIKKNKIIYFAVADCTGHGVPGAFMSMLGISYLNEIIARNEQNSPGGILNILRSFFINAWQEHSETLTDSTMMEGMDIAFCSLHTETLEMMYAGANNPVYIVSRKQEAESSQVLLPAAADCQLVELTGDKMPVGNHDRKQDFTSHRIQLYKGDQLYLMSDGYKSQLGGNKHTKFLVKNIKKMLIEISSKSLSEQKLSFETALNDWQSIGGNLVEQTDDITVMALKI